ncbi:ABC transporter AbcH.1 [Coelomomyces lativittatus]|nr:ABC transporter AbcH.1 [Coelomomyces lativittatus]KAJ1512770.1 ABC transporter AbcH.1 [Coelomomyces lativittatus]KAJ1517430.1 ABC transporter AbcH.1 [Coelomomyces lativittatus]
METQNTPSFSVIVPMPNDVSTPIESNQNVAFDPIIEIKNVHKTYLIGLDGVPALRGVNLKIYPGEWVMIYGTSGGGKTSLLNLMGTIDKPTKGEVRICGEVITSMTTDESLAEMRLHQLGFVFQNFNLLPSMTALENVSLPMILNGTRRHHRRTTCERSFKQIGLSHRLHHFPNQLSGGEQQRVTFARAMANSPSLILLDEPTGDLDSANTLQIMKILHKVNSEQKTTLVMVTHDIYLKNFAHRVLWLRDGKLVKEEIVSPTRRSQALQDLYSDLQKHTKEDTSTPVVLTESRTASSYATYSEKAYKMALAYREKYAT